MLRKATVVVLGFVVLFAQGLAAAPPAAAAETWSREVRFPAEGTDGDEFERVGQLTDSCEFVARYEHYHEELSPVTQTGSVAPSGHCEGGAGGWYAPLGMHTDTDSTPPYVSPDEWAPEGVKLRVRGNFAAYPSYSCAETSTQTMNVYVVFLDDFGAELDREYLVEAATVTTCDEFEVSGLWDYPPTSAAFQLNFTLTGGWNRGVKGLEIDEISGEGTAGSDCHGVPGAGSDSDLVWPSVHLTSPTHDMWGDGYSSGGCRFDTAGVFYYSPPEGLDTGDTHQFGVQISSGPARAGSISLHWACFAGSDGGPGRSIMAFSYLGEDEGAAGAGAQIRKSNVPPGAGCIEVVVREATYLHGLLISNVEGDPIQDNGEDGTGAPPSNANCVPGADALDVGTWVVFIGCQITSAVSDVWTAILGLPGFIAAAIGDMLHTLFVPVELGDAWDDFTALMSSRVPMVYVAEVVGFLSGMLTTSNLAGGSLATSMTIMGATVPIDYGAVFGPLEPYRFVLAGLVYVGTGLLVFRSIKSAMGGGGSDDKGLGA